MPGRGDDSMVGLMPSDEEKDEDRSPADADQ